MRPSEMHRLGHRGCHSCCPKAWRNVPVLSGDYDFDATIEHRSNKDLPARLNLYLKRNSSAYGPVTNYDGYHNYRGDD